MPVTFTKNTEEANKEADKTYGREIPLSLVRPHSSPMDVYLRLLKPAKVLVYSSKCRELPIEELDIDSEKLGELLELMPEYHYIVYAHYVESLNCSVKFYWAKIHGKFTLVIAREQKDSSDLI